MVWSNFIPSAFFISLHPQKRHHLLPSHKYSTTTSTIGMTGTKKASKRLYSFFEARKIARGHGFDSKEEFIEYECAGAYQLPKDADVVWKEVRFLFLS